MTHSDVMTVHLATTQLSHFCATLLPNLMDMSIWHPVWMTNGPLVHSLKNPMPSDLELASTGHYFLV
jgi:hypothetical protein